MSNLFNDRRTSEWDPDGFKLDHAFAKRIRPATRRNERIGPKTGEPFLRGPIPMDWLHQAAKLGVSPLWVGCLLWHLAGLKKSSAFLVSNFHLNRWGIERRAKSRALKVLSDAGLITVAGRGKRSPRVTIIVARDKGMISNDLDTTHL